MPVITQKDKNSGDENNVNPDLNSENNELTKEEKSKAKIEAKIKAKEEKEKAKAEAKELKENKNQSKPVSKDLYYVIPGSKPSNGTVGFMVQKKNDKNKYVNTERSHKLVDGAVIVPSGLSEDKRREMIVELEGAGFRQTSKDSDYFIDQNPSKNKKSKILSTLIHPDIDKADEDSSEYLLKYDDAGMPVTVTFTVLKSVLKTTNDEWAKMLVGVGFRLDKQEKIKN